MWGSIQVWIPGVLAGIVVAVFFADGLSMSIVAIGFCFLITISINMYRDNQLLQGQIFNLNEKVNALALATSDELDNLSEDTNESFHEVFKILADNIHGSEED